MSPSVSPTTSEVHRGRCGCGAVRYTVTGPLRDVVNCHCERCRRVTGHHMAATAADAEHVEIEHGGELRWWEPAPGVFYGFCATCGATLFWRVDVRPAHLSIAAGTLDQPTGLRTTSAWWVAEAGDYHDRPPGLVEHPYDG